MNIGSYIWLDPGEEIPKHLSLHLGMNSDHYEKEDGPKGKNGKLLVI